jgi:hypothetical protein
MVRAGVVNTSPALYILFRVRTGARLTIFSIPSLENRPIETMRRL